MLIEKKLIDYKIKKKAAFISLFFGIGMFISKISAYFITGSAAIFSDAAESVVHVLATGMALYSIILSSMPEDEDHPYGHGKIEYFSAGVEGSLILIAALYIIYEAVQSIILGPQLKRLDVGIAVVAAAGIINLFLGWYLIRQGKKTNSLTLVADGKHVLTDSYTSIGVLVGIIIVYITNIHLFDPIFAIGVALNILFTGYSLVKQSVKGLMNEVDKDLQQKILDTLISFRRDYWIDIHEFRFWQAGETIFIDFHLILPFYFSVRDSHTEENEIEAELKRVFPHSQLKIHFDYCLDDLCRFCKYDCKERTAAHINNFAWDIKKMTGKPVYEYQDKELQITDV